MCIRDRYIELLYQGYDFTGAFAVSAILVLMAVIIPVSYTHLITSIAEAMYFFIVRLTMLLMSELRLYA